MQHETVGRGRAHGMGHLKKGAQERLREFVSLGIGHDEENQGRNE